MKYQVRIFLKRIGTRELRRELVKYGFAIYKENRMSKKMLEVDESNDEASSDHDIIEMSDSRNVFDCFLNTDDILVIHNIQELIEQKTELVYSFVINYAIDDDWRFR